MAKDKKARELGHMTLGALGIIMGATVDTMRAADVPNDLLHIFLDRLEDGFDHVLCGPAAEIMVEFVDAIRANVASND